MSIWTPSNLCSSKISFSNSSIVDRWFLRFVLFFFILFFFLLSLVDSLVSGAEGNFGCGRRASQVSRWFSMHEAYRI